MLSKETLVSSFSTIFFLSLVLSLFFSTKKYQLKHCSHVWFFFDVVIIVHIMIIILCVPSLPFFCSCLAVRRVLSIYMLVISFLFFPSSLRHGVFKYSHYLYGSFLLSSSLFVVPSVSFLFVFRDGSFSSFISR